MGIKNLPDALALARQADLDLVEVAPMASPPVCRIMDYGKFRYEESQKHDFLAEGHKVKVTLQFRGREMAHPELGSRILDAVLEQLGPTAKVETQARLEGRNMTMVLAPDKTKIVPKKPSEDKPHSAEEPASDAAPAEVATEPAAEVAEVSEPVVAPETEVAPEPTPEPDPA